MYDGRESISVLKRPPFYLNNKLCTRELRERLVRRKLDPAMVKSIVRAWKFEKGKGPKYKKARKNAKKTQMCAKKKRGEGWVKKKTITNEKKSCREGK